MQPFQPLLLLLLPRALFHSERLFQVCQNRIGVFNAVDCDFPNWIPLGHLNAR